MSHSEAIVLEAGKMAECQDLSDFENFHITMAEGVRLEALQNIKSCGVFLVCIG